MNALRPEKIHTKKDASGNVIMKVIEFENSGKVEVSNWRTGKSYMCSKDAGRQMWKEAK